MAERPFYEQAQAVSQQTGIPADFVWAQWYHETGGFDNWGAHNGYNIAGMKQFKEQPAWFNGDATSPEGDNYQVFDGFDDFTGYFSRYMTKYFPEACAAQSVEDYAAALKRGGYYGESEGQTPEDSVRNYIGGMHSALGSQSAGWNGAGLWGNTGTNSFGTAQGTEATAPKQQTVWENMQDQWQKGLEESPIYAAYRTAWERTTVNAQDPLVIDEDTIKRVVAALPGNPTAQRWVLTTADSKEDLENLIARKQADAAREARIQDFQRSWYEKAPGFLANLAAITVTDPTILIPIGGAKIAGQAGKDLMKAAFGMSNAAGTIAMLGPEALRGMPIQTIIRMGENAAIQTGLFTGMGKLREITTGEPQDYQTLALMGAFAGGGLSLVGDAFGAFAKNRQAARFVDALDGMQKAAVAKTLGLEAPGELVPVSKALNGLHDEGLLKALGSDAANQLAAGGKLMVVSEDALAKVASQMGINPEAVPSIKGFFDPKEGITVINGTKAAAEGYSIENILSHEYTHKGLANADQATVDMIQKHVERNMNNPDSTWATAMRKAANQGDWQEVLGHWIEDNVSKPETFASTIMRNVKNAMYSIYPDAIKMTDADLKDFAVNTLKNEVEAARGYKVLPDGGVVSNGLYYSADSMANPNVLDGILDIVPKTPLGRFSEWWREGPIYKNPFGILINSPVKAAREMAGKLFENARKAAKPGEAGAISVERQAKFFNDQLLPHYNNFLTAREEYLGKGGVINQERLKDFNEAVFRRYNQKYGNMKAGGVTEGFPPEVDKAVESLRALRTRQIELAKTSAEIFGEPAHKNHTRPEWESLSDELWRRVDDQKWAAWAKVTTQEERISFLEDYYKQFAKRKDIGRELELEMQMRVDKANARAENAGADVLFPEHGVALVTPEMIEERVAEYAKKWALGVGDQNLSNLVAIKGSGLTEKLGAEGFMAARFPLDTSGVVKDSFGREWSFDSMLRSTDIDRIVPASVKRASGELALHNVFPDKAALDDFRARMISALSKGEAIGKVGPNEMKRQIEAFDRGIDAIRGITRWEETNTMWSAVMDTIRSLSYAKNGAMFGMNQLGEMSGPIAMTGLKTISHVVPALRDMIQEARHQGASAIREMEMKMFGENTERYMWKTNYQSKRYTDALTEGSAFAPVLDKLDSGIKLAGRVTSSASQLTRLTDWMIRGVRQETIIDSIRWAKGESVGSIIRKPFSDKKLAAAGITDGEALKADLRKYSEGSALDVDRWMKESPDSYWKYHSLIDNAGQMAVEQHTIGNTPLLFHGSSTMRAIGQFKDFSMRVVNSQVARAMTMKELDSTLALMGSMVTNAGLYVGLVYGKAWAMFPDSPSKRDRYINARITPSQVALAGFLRGSVGSALSLGTDLYEAFTGSGTFRTSVNADYGRSQTPRELTATERLGRGVQQIPAVGTVVDAAAGAGGLYDLVRQKADQKDLANIMSNFPMRTFLPMLRIQQLVKDSSGLPEKRKN